MKVFAKQYMTSFNKLREQRSTILADDLCEFSAGARTPPAGYWESLPSGPPMCTNTYIQGVSTYSTS